MSVNMFDQPIGGDFMNTYAKLPFQEIAFMGDKLRNASDEVHAHVGKLQQDLKSPVLEQDRQRLKEIFGKYEDRLNSINDLYKSDPFRAKEEAHRIGQDIHEDMNRGEVSAIKDRYDWYQNTNKKLYDTYGDSKSGQYDPRLYNFYKNQIGVEDLNYDQSTGKYGSISAPQTDKIFQLDELDKHYDNVIKNISSDQILLQGAPKELASVPFSQLLEMPGAKKYIDFSKVSNALTGATTPEIQRSEEVLGLAQGLGEGQGSFVNKDGTYNLNSSLGRMLHTKAGGKAFTEYTRGDVRTLSDDLGSYGAKQDRDNKYVISGQGNTVKRGTITNADGEPIKDYDTFKETIDGISGTITKLQDELAAVAPTNTQLKQQYLGQIEDANRKKNQYTKILDESLNEAARQEGWTKDENGYYVSDNGERVLSDYLFGGVGVNDELESSVNDILKEKLKGRDLTLNRYMGTGDKKTDQYYSKRLYDYAATSTLTDDNGNKFTLGDLEISKDELKRLQSGNVNVSFSETPDHDFGTYGLQFTLDGKTYTLPAPKEYEAEKLNAKTPQDAQVKKALFNSQLDWSEASRLPEALDGVPSKSGLGNYYFDAYKGQTLTGANFIFVPAKGTKLDMDGDSNIEIADGKTAISIDKDKNALTKIFMLNK